MFELPADHDGPRRVENVMDHHKEQHAQGNAAPEGQRDQPGERDLGATGDEEA
jgi:hypothetical protein